MKGDSLMKRLSHPTAIAAFPVLFTLPARWQKNALNSIIFVAVDDLDYLKRGGRITPAAAAIPGQTHLAWG